MTDTWDNEGGSVFSKKWDDSLDDETYVTRSTYDDDAFWKWYHRVCAEAYQQYKIKDLKLSDNVMVICDEDATVGSVVDNPKSACIIRLETDE